MLICSLLLGRVRLRANRNTTVTPILASSSSDVAAGFSLRQNPEGCGYDSAGAPSSPKKRLNVCKGIVIGLALFLAGGAQAQVQVTNHACISTTWYSAEVEGRTLWVNEQSVALRIDARTEVQVGWQRFVAKGRVRTNRFSTNSRWYGLEHVLREESDRKIVLSLRRLEGGEGTADVAEGLFTYTAPRIDTTSLLSVQQGGDWGKGYRLSYSRIHAGTEAADTIGLSLLAFPAQSSRWQVQLEGGIYADRRGDTTYRPVFGGFIGFQLGQDLHAKLGVTLAPRGFPIAGTSLEGLTAFTLYRPGSLVESWRDRPAGTLSLQITAGR